MYACNAREGIFIIYPKTILVCNSECCKALSLFNFIAIFLTQLMKILVKRNALFQHNERAANFFVKK